MVAQDGLTPLQDKVTAVQDFPTPSSVKKLQEFLGMVTYYHQFLSNITSTFAPLYNILKNKPKKLTWNSEQEEAFKKAKQALAGATMLAYPRPGSHLLLTTDASDAAVGAVLEQSTPSGPQPLAFFSKKLTTTQTKYSGTSTYESPYIRNF